MKDMYRAQSRFTGASQIFDRIFDEYGASGVNTFVGEDVAHERDRGLGAEASQKLHLLDPPKVIKAAQNP